MKCNSCSFLPESKTDVARSFYLSSSFKVKKLGLPKSSEELDNYSQQLKKGEPVNYEGYIIQQIEAQSDFADVYYLKYKTIRNKAIAFIALLILVYVVVVLTNKL